MLRNESALPQTAHQTNFKKKCLTPSKSKSSFKFVCQCEPHFWFQMLRLELNHYSLAPSTVLASNGCLVKSHRMNQSLDPCAYKTMNFKLSRLVYAPHKSIYLFEMLMSVIQGLLYLYCISGKSDIVRSSGAITQVQILLFHYQNTSLCQN